MFPGSYKAARRKEEKIYGPRLMGKLELREGAPPPGEEALSLEMRFTDDGGGGHLPQRPGVGGKSALYSLCGQGEKEVGRSSVLLQNPT